MRFPKTASPLGLILRALDNPVRLQMLVLLLQRDWSPSDLAHEVGHAVQVHLDALADAGLVSRRREGRVVVYRAQNVLQGDGELTLRGVGVELVIRLLTAKGSA